MTTTWLRWRGASGSRAAPQRHAERERLERVQDERQARRSRRGRQPGPRGPSSQVVAPSAADSSRTRRSARLRLPRPAGRRRGPRLADGDGAVAELQRVEGRRGYLARLGQLEDGLVGDAVGGPATASTTTRDGSASSQLERPLDVRRRPHPSARALRRGSAANRSSHPAASTAARPVGDPGTEAHEQASPGRRTSGS